MHEDLGAVPPKQQQQQKTSDLCLNVISKEWLLRGGRTTNTKINHFLLFRAVYLWCLPSMYWVGICPSDCAGTDQWLQLLRRLKQEAHFILWLHDQHCQHSSEICLLKNKRMYLMYLTIDYSSFSISEMLLRESTNTELLEWLPSFLESLVIFFTVFISVFLSMLFLEKIHFCFNVNISMFLYLWYI